MNLFGVNKSPIEIISEGAFGVTYFRDIYSGVNGKWYEIFIQELMASGIVIVGKSLSF